MGFNIGEFVQSEGYKKVMAKVYGWGASVVLAGALFKIQHYPGASYMLIAGMGTEIVIFFLSAFEPLHHETDWSLVYPELAGVGPDDEVEIKDEKPVSSKKSALEKFDEMIENAEITPELFERLGAGLQSLNQTTEKLQDVSDATAATNNYVANFEKASEKVNEFADMYGDSASKLSQTTEHLKDTITSSSEKLSNSYIETANKVNETGDNLAQAYSKLTESMNQEFEDATEGNKSYGEQLQVMTKNLTALNAVYELQLQGTNEHLEASKQLYDGLNEMMENLHESVGDTKKYREEVAKLSNNLAAMNTVYGNMLSAMNVKID